MLIWSRPSGESRALIGTGFQLPEGYRQVDSVYGIKGLSSLHNRLTPSNPYITPERLCKRCSEGGEQGWPRMAPCCRASIPCRSPIHLCGFSMSTEPISPTLREVCRRQSAKSVWLPGLTALKARSSVFLQFPGLPGSKGMKVSSGALAPGRRRPPATLAGWLRSASSPVFRAHMTSSTIISHGLTQTFFIWRRTIHCALA